MNLPSPTIIRRPDLGLAIAGTCITIYTIMKYMREGWSQQDIGEWFNLTTEQTQVALEYIEAHHSEVEAAYDEKTREAEERRLYWEARLRKQLAHQPRSQPSPEKAALYAKLAEQRAQTIHGRVDDIGTSSHNMNRPTFPL